MDLKVNLGNYELDNPIIPASGTFGFGYDFANFYDINKLGSFSTKGITKEKRFGNQTPRIAECENGMLNSIGLQNPGVEDVINNEFEKLKLVFSKKVIANIGGNTIEDYVFTAKKLDKEDIVAILEINVSCPNVAHGGITFGTNKEILKELIIKLKKECKKPIYVKLSPNVTDIVDIAKACEQSGADGLVLINTLLGMRIDINQRKPILANIQGGYSGASIFPVALRNVYQVYKNVNIPIIGVGGIKSAKDVVEMMMAGASAVQIGSENLVDPYACSKIIDDLEKLLKTMNIKDIKDIIGVANE